MSKSDSQSICVALSCAEAGQFEVRNKLFGLLGVPMTRVTSLQELGGAGMRPATNAMKVRMALAMQPEFVVLTGHDSCCVLATSMTTLQQIYQTLSVAPDVRIPVYRFWFFHHLTNGWLIEFLGLPEEAEQIVRICVTNFLANNGHNIDLPVLRQMAIDLDLGEDIIDDLIYAGVLIVSADQCCEVTLAPNANI
jgi:hypothetical protein